MENFPTTVLQKMCVSVILTKIKDRSDIKEFPLPESIKNLLKDNIAISGSKRMSHDKICKDILRLPFFSSAYLLDEVSAESKKLKVL